MNILNELQDVFREVFDDDRLVLTPEMTARDIDGWDSLSNITLMMAIEVKFQIKIAFEAQALFRNIGDIVGYVTLHKGI